MNENNNDKEKSQDELWARIRFDWETNPVTYRDLEKKYGVRMTTIRSRRSREGWERAEGVEIPISPAVLKPKGKPPEKTKKHKYATTDEIHVKIPFAEKDDPQKRRASREQIYNEDLDDDLTDLQRLFCIHYMSYFNATKAYQKAYGVSHSVARNNANKLMRTPKIQKQIELLKKEQVIGLKLDAMDVLQRYIDIAFADITDFIDYGTEEIDVIDKNGKKTGTRQVNYARFRDGIDIDGTLVSEVKLGKDGIGIKMHDKMKAMEMLTKYFDLLDLETKKRLEEEKLKMEIKRLEEDHGNAETGRTIIVTGEDEMRRVLNERSGGSKG